MLDAVLAARDPIRARIAAAPALAGGIRPKLYVGDIDDNTLPYFWIRTSNETESSRTLGRNTDNFYIDAYSRSIGELQQMFNIIAFLDDVQLPTYGNAVNPRFSIESKTELPEGARVWHGTALYSVEYGDARKLLQV